MKKYTFKNMTFSDIPKFFKDLVAGKKDDSAMMTGQTGKYEVNLVPDVKLEMIRLKKVVILYFLFVLWFRLSRSQHWWCWVELREHKIF